MAIHNVKPARRQVEAKNRYSEYREDLRQDFNGACGYCDDNDLLVDRSCFHIDHFAPKSLFPHLENSYSNLIYACRFCNVRKSNHWVGENPAVHHDGLKGFIDPCSVDYEQHLCRDVTGQIYGITELGKYIVKRLNLNLLRHQLLWRARRTRLLRNEVEVLIERYKTINTHEQDIYIDLLERFMRLTKEIEEYEFAAVQR